ncbi:MAG: aldo/keto reductase [Erysipelotrichaceae bacterium]|nr:aldo/keto reductase [Erysipelotrichaceae bacterium]MBR2827008.1 aldo/keto reductase [Erysipelotrichaceae bacterium]
MTTEKYTFSDSYRISRVLNGCWQLSLGHSLNGPLDPDDVMKAFYRLRENGFTTFDCADIYTGAEEFIGSFISELKKDPDFDERDIQIHTKYVPDLEYLSRVDYDFTRSIIERSLRRLNKKQLDVVQFHWWDYEVDGMVQTASYLQRLKEEGLIGHVSVTNFNTEHLKMLVDAGIEITSCQAQYSFFDRRVEKGLQAYCLENDIPLICYGTLAGGFLSERYIGKKREDIVPETRSQVKYLQVIEDSLGWQGYQDLLVILKEVADGHGVGISQVATRFILQQKAVAAAVIGVRNSRHVDDNARIFSFTLTDEELNRLREFVDRYPVLPGEPFELERTAGSKYRNIMHMNINEEEQAC